MQHIRLSVQAHCEGQQSRVVFTLVSTYLGAKLSQNLVIIYELTIFWTLVVISGLKLSWKLVIILGANNILTWDKLA